MAKKKDLTTEVLIQIRDELKSTREQLASRIDQTNSRLERVEHRQTESELRLASELVNVVSAINQLKDLIVADRDLRHRVDEHDKRISALERPAS